MRINLLKFSSVEWYFLFVSIAGLQCTDRLRRITVAKVSLIKIDVGRFFKSYALLDLSERMMYSYSCKKEWCTLTLVRKMYSDTSKKKNDVLWHLNKWFNMTNVKKWCTLTDVWKHSALWDLSERIMYSDTY